MSERSFFIVWSPQGRTPPTCRHDTEPAAIREAERLASLNPGAEFFVLEAVAVSHKPVVQTRRFYREPPF